MNHPHPLGATFAVGLIMAFPCAEAATLASWTFETNTPPDVSGSTSGPSALASSGIYAMVSTATGFHTNPSNWTTPDGITNAGGANSFSSDNWSVGDYYQFTTRSSGYNDLTIRFSQAGDFWGPKNFELRYSTNGTQFTTFASYTVTNSDTAASTSYQFDLSNVPALDNLPIVYFRLVDTSTTAIGTFLGFSLPVLSSGTSRVDNITISGTAAVPEPSNALAGALIAWGLFFRHRRLPSRRKAFISPCP